MTIIEQHVQRDDLWNMRVSMTALELQHTADNIQDYVQRSIAYRLEQELLPLIREHVAANMDWAAVTRMTQEAIAKRIADIVTPEKPK